MMNHLEIAAISATLPPVWERDPLPTISALATERTLVVLDDDPTGTQTVRDVAVVTTWDEATLRAELEASPTGFYILTNSRSLEPEASACLHRELAANLRAASAAAGRPIVALSRSDSTLRGHYPLETDTLAATLGPFDITLIAPYFAAGGRRTYLDSHYVAEGPVLVPVAATPFARDTAFGYRHSHLPSWVEEKTAGRIAADAVASLPLDLIRSGGPEAVAAQLAALPRGSVCIANAWASRDIEVVALGSLLAERCGLRLLYRTAASFVAARLGQATHSSLLATELAPTDGDAAGPGLVVVGSHVPKSSAQLAQLLADPSICAIELPVEAVLDTARCTGALAATRAAVDASLAAGRDTVVYTSRRLAGASGAAASLAAGRRISDTLCALVRELATAPRWLVAKGGITSSDIATRALGVRRALVRGQLLPGVPVWRLGAETRLPGRDYVVFPGNVGDDSALAEAVARLRLANTR